MTTLAVIGGSGLYQLPGLTVEQTVEVSTPYGAPSGPVVCARLEETRLLFLPRHGPGHTLLPHQINSRANICALKKLGAEQVVSVSAVGSLKEEIAPGEVVIVDQYIDRTHGRISTFFDGGIGAHVSMAEPICPALAECAAASAEREGARVHRGGTYLCMNGPQFSTRAESLLYKSWGVSVIGMTALPEAKLAREAELPYATLAFVTDYDCWRISEEAVNVETVLGVLHRNVSLAQRLLQGMAAALPDPTLSPASTALQNALITAPGFRSEKALRDLSWLLG